MLADLDLVTDNSDHHTHWEVVSIMFGDDHIVF